MALSERSRGKHSKSSSDFSGTTLKESTVAASSKQNDDDDDDDDTFSAVFKSRVTVLVTLMIVQSLSGMILSSFEELIQDNVVITLFLTMLVGAGGNAGNQSTVNVITGLATGKVTMQTQGRVLKREAKLGLTLGLVLAIVAFLRVWLVRADFVAGLAIGIASLAIVAVSAVMGAALPLLFVRVGLDAAHAGPAIQVAMDVIGVTLTCLICSSVFDYFGDFVAMSEEKTEL